MEKEYNCMNDIGCNFMCSNVLNITHRVFRTKRERSIYTISKIPLINHLASTTNATFKSFMSKISSDKSTSDKRAFPEIKGANRKLEALNLQEGERVQVCTKEEIFETLDKEGKNKGLLFMPEMIKFCGKEFVVFKKVERIVLESTGELRKIKSPTVFLEGVMCDGEFHDQCQRSCFLYWREIWLRRPTCKEQ